MPSTYAHYRFGKMVLASLTKEQQQCINNYRELFDIGLHGPDLLFYFQPLKRHPINQFGYAMHEKPALAFFEKARTIVKSDEDLAYIYGFICHFALDAKCHPYVEKEVSTTVHSHTKIEVEFDRFLLLTDKLNPLSYHMTQHIHPSRKNAQVISQFFDIASPKDINKALRSMNFYARLLHAQNGLKRQLLYTGMNIVGANSFKEQIMPKEADVQLAGSNMDLYTLFDQAISDASALIMDFETNLHTQTPLSRAYLHSFGEN